MAEHRARRRLLPSVRTRALLSLGLVLGLGVSGTLAYWTDDVQVSGATFTAGTLDINVNGGDPYTAATELSMAAMVPGSSSAQVLTVNNVGNVRAKYTITGGLSGANAADYSAAGGNGLLLTIRSGGSTSGTGSTATCTGGTVVLTETPLTSTTTTPLLAKRPTTPLAASGGSESLCFQVRLAPTAPSSLQTKTTNATFTVTGTSDLS